MFKGARAGRLAAVIPALADGSQRRRGFDADAAFDSRGVDLAPLGPIVRSIVQACRQPFVWDWGRVWYGMIRLTGPGAAQTSVAGEVVAAMDRRELVLAVLAAGKGRPFSPAQIQKAVFLIDKNLPHLIHHARDLTSYRTTMGRSIGAFILRLRIYSANTRQQFRRPQTGAG